MLGWTRNARHAGRYNFFLYIVGLKSPQFWLLFSESSLKNGSHIYKATVQKEEKFVDRLIYHMELLSLQISAEVFRSHLHFLYCVPQNIEISHGHDISQLFSNVSDVDYQVYDWQPPPSFLVWGTLIHVASGDILKGAVSKLQGEWQITAYIWSRAILHPSHWMWAVIFLLSIWKYHFSRSFFFSRKM